MDDETELLEELSDDLDEDAELSDDLDEDTDELELEDELIELDRDLLEDELAIKFYQC